MQKNGGREIKCNNNVKKLSADQKFVDSGKLIRPCIQTVNRNIEKASRQLLQQRFDLHETLPEGTCDYFSKH